ncbi:MAG: hypothetical protein J7K47_03390 [Thermoplasmata archaeon]|nr:hypothetical protein [Thermoplasmata archaeon]
MKKLVLFVAFILVFSINIKGSGTRFNESNMLYFPSHPILPFEVKNYVLDSNIVIKKVDVKIKNITAANIKINFAKSPRAIGEQIEYKNREYPQKWYDYTIRMGLFNGKISKFLTIYLFPYRYMNGPLMQADFDVNVSIEFDNTIQKLGKSGNYDMLIISPSSLLQYAYELSNYKNNIGVSTIVASLDRIYRQEDGRDNAEKIKRFIKDEIEKDGIKYVLLFGDADIVPVRYVKTEIDQPSKVPTDLYYADIYRGDGSFSSWDENGNGIYGEKEDNADYVPDVYIGRLPVDTAREAQIVVDKIKHFEMPAQRAIFVGTELFPDTNIREGEYLKDYVAEALKNFDIKKLYEIDGKAKASKIIDEINKGAMFVNFASHGNPYSMVWQTGSWSIEDVDRLSNGYRLPVVFAMACLTNDFDEADCLGEEFLLHEGGGAIAYIGSVRVAYVYVEKSIKSSLSGYLDYAFFKSYYDGLNETGSIFSNAIVYYIMHSYFLPAIDRLTITEFNMLGDPSIKLPLIKNTSRAYVLNSIGKEIDVYAHSSYDGKAELYYRQKGRGKWNYYGESEKPYHWKFIPPEEGIYELCSKVDDEDFPLHGDCYCIYDVTPPEIEVENPVHGVYIFGNKIMDLKRNVTIAIGNVTIGGRVKDSMFKEVKIFIDDSEVYSSTQQKFSFDWGGLKFGMHYVKIVAEDIAGNTAEKDLKIFRIL